MKKIGLFCLLLIGSMHLMAQNNSRTDSLSGAPKIFGYSTPNLKIPNLLRLNPKDNALSTQLFKYQPVDSWRSSTGKSPFITGYTISRTDNMPIANLPSNSRMPVYKLSRSNDKMPGSNPPPAPVAPVVPSK